MIMMMGWIVRGFSDDLGVSEGEYHNDRVDTLCQSEKLTGETVINEHPASCGGVYVFSRWQASGLSAQPQTAVLLVGRQTKLKRKAVINSAS